MPFYEYKVVPAPERAPKVKGLKGPAKFAQGLESLMNELAQDGWEYQRAESLPDEEKKGLMGGRETVTRNILVFRRELYFEENAETIPAEVRPQPRPSPCRAGPSPRNPRAHRTAPSPSRRRRRHGRHLCRAPRPRRTGTRAHAPPPSRGS
jgi:hypothetical protein